MGIFSRQAASRLWREAEKQLDIAISWGRHAELFAYDDVSGELYLESDVTRVLRKARFDRTVRGLADLSVQERADGFMLLQQDDAENFFST